MISLAAVRAWPLDALDDAVLVTDRGAERVYSAGSRAQSAIGSGPEWTGATRDAAAHRIAVHGARGKRLVVALESVSTAGRRAIGELRPLRARLLELTDTALGGGFVVADDGRVRHPAPRRRADAEYLESRIRGLLTQLADLDGQVGAHLATLADELSGLRVEAVDVLARLEPMTVAARRLYWDSLWPDEAAALTSAAPQRLGSLDGIPFATRIAVNDRLIRRALADEIAAGRSGDRRAAALREMLDGGRRFLAFDNSGSGRYIEQVGDITGDIAGAAVLVPGTGSRLENSADQHRRALALSRRSGAPVLVYADGALPQQVLPSSISAYRGTAVDPAPAAQMGRRLVDFGRALDTEIAAHAPRTAVTYIGHSYGGSVVGTAQQYGLRADNIVFASSAGTGVADGPWRDPNPDVRRYSMTPPGDLIHLAQKYGALAHGGDPDTAPGVRRLDTGYYSEQGARPGALIQGFSAHSDYLDDPGSTAFDNLAAVVSGKTPTPYVERAPDIRYPG